MQPRMFPGPASGRAFHGPRWGRREVPARDRALGLGEDVMLMSQLAMMNLGPSPTSVLARLQQAVARYFGFGEVPPELRDVLRPDAAAPQGQAPAAPALRIHIVQDVASPAGDPTAFRWRRHPQLRHPNGPSLPHNLREARAHAVRALYAARAGDLEAARRSFARAAAEPTLDLCEAPGFWKLSRGGMLAAVDAYEEAGRLRDAAALSARIRTMFRPRALIALPANVTELPERKFSVSSGS